jgi:glycine/D-amino acid oxidase-like deaminating enzyme
VSGGPAARAYGRSYRDVSFWLDDLAAAGLDDLEPRPSLDGDAQADVAIVGAGFTGLWTAYYLLRADPSLSVLLLEREIAGYGASGRNGGWCSALFPASAAKLARAHGREAAIGLRRAMQDTVDEVGRAAAEEGIDCHFRKGGTVVAARSAVQFARARASVAKDAELGGVDGLELLDAAQTRARVGVTRATGGVWTPHCARIHPGRLVRGLARAVERRGGRIAERTTVTAIEPGQVRTDRGTVRARHVVRATEGWTPTLPASRRDAVPVYSLMVATQPLPDDFWSRAGLAAGETFSDERHLIIYGQRTADGRLAFGGRGAPYHFGSRVDPAHDRVERVFSKLRATLVDLFPDLAGHGFTHAWGGPLAISRDWTASVGLDRATGLGWAGGYVGDGVGTTNLAGRTLTDLVLGRDTALTRLPWVGHRSRRWEPEPLRWLGLNAGVRVVGLADAEERLTGRESLIARAMAPLLGE